MKHNKEIIILKAVKDGVNKSYDYSRYRACNTIQRLKGHYDWFHNYEMEYLVYKLLKDGYLFETKATRAIDRKLKLTQNGIERIIKSDENQHGNNENKYEYLFRNNSANS